MEDLSQYWDLPNKYETDLCYIQEVDNTNLGYKNEDVFPKKIAITKFIYENLAEENKPRFPHWYAVKNFFKFLTIANTGIFLLI